MIDTSAIATIRFETRPVSGKKKLAEAIVIGKDILELVSGAMYVEPMTILREYIQNAVDAIDEARAADLYGKKDQPRVEITADLVERRLQIRDNGIGVGNAAFARRLTAFGASQKRGTQARGFRGVGRLSGLGYCQELIFRSRTPGDPEVMELVWDGRRFKDILLDSRYQGDLNQVIREVTTLSSVSGANHPKHFFEVELRGVARHKNDILLNEHEITDYLAQVAPVPFHPSFTQGDKINERLQSFGLGNSYEIFVRSTATEVAEPKQVFRPYRNTFTVFGGNKDRVRNIDFLEWTGLDGNVAAIAWALNHNYLGAIPKSEGVRGLRLRSGNIQVGSDEILADVFPEPRFNSWMIGEIHTITPKLIPNGRRDAFEANVHYTNLVGHASAYAKLVAKTCRDRSKIRNQERRFNLEKEKLHEKLALISRSSLPRSMKDKFRGEIALHVKVLEKLVNSISGQTLRKRLENELVQIKTRAGKNLDEVLLRDPLARLPKKHQELYRETIGLIFECAPNRNVASALVERMLAKLVRKC